MIPGPHDDTPPLFATLPVRLGACLGVLFLVGALAADLAPVVEPWIAALFDPPAYDASGSAAPAAPAPQQQAPPAGQGPTAR